MANRTRHLNLSWQRHERHAARKSGSLRTSHTVIERRIIDPKEPARPVMEGDASEAD